MNSVFSYGHKDAEEVVSVAPWCWKGELRSKVIECTAATAVMRDVDGRVGGNCHDLHGRVEMPRFASLTPYSQVATLIDKRGLGDTLRQCASYDFIRLLAMPCHDVHELLKLKLIIPPKTKVYFTHRSSFIFTTSKGIAKIVEGPLKLNSTTKSTILCLPKKPK